MGTGTGRYKVRQETIHVAEISRMKEVEDRVQEGKVLRGQVEEELHSSTEGLRIGQYYHVFPFPSFSPKAL